MARVRGKGNKATELALVSLFRRHKITGWRRHLCLFGNPDFAFPKKKVVIFVDGCFWHSCPVHASQPTTNSAFWERKLYTNRCRDRLVTHALKKQGWKVLRIWQHALSRKNEIRCLMRIKKILGEA